MSWSIVVICNVKEVFDRRPAWVEREISQKEAAMLTRRIKETGATSGAEIGVASGFSTAVLYSALSQNTTSPRLHSFDLSHDCYFDKSRKTGDAFKEIHGDAHSLLLTCGVTSANLPAFEPVDFILIDANHATPWVAFDLLSLGRYLKPGGWVAIDDAEMIFRPKWLDGGKNGGRDLYRAWRGPKIRFQGATTMNFLEGATPDFIAQSVADSLNMDWDERLEPEQIAAYIDMAAYYGEKAQSRIAKIIKLRRKTAGRWRPTTPPEGYLELPDF